MSIFIGNSEIKNVYIGTTPVKEVYVGTTKVRPTTPPCLCFTANTSNSTVKLNKNGSPASVTLETSTDGNTWNTYSFGTTITLSNVGDKVYWRNTSSTTTQFSRGVGDYYNFAMSGSVSASGDVTYLINKNGSMTVSNYCFTFLFLNCSSLTSTPSIPANTLGERCYYFMFSDCANLSTLPKLPATTLPDFCYYGMFIRCPNIKISTNKTGIYQTAYRIPTAGTGIAGSYSLYMMFSNTGGTYVGTAFENTTYYTSNAVV